MDVEDGTEAAKFPEKKYINKIFVAVYTVSPTALAVVCNHTPAPTAEKSEYRTAKRMPASGVGHCVRPLTQTLFHAGAWVCRT
jgi:hypothetical protein